MITKRIFKAMIEEANGNTGAVDRAYEEEEKAIENGEAEEDWVRESTEGWRFVQTSVSGPQGHTIRYKDGAFEYAMATLSDLTPDEKWVVTLSNKDSKWEHRTQDWVTKEIMLVLTGDEGYEEEEAKEETTRTIISLLRTEG